MATGRPTAGGLANRRRGAAGSAPHWLGGGTSRPVWGRGGPPLRLGGAWWAEAVRSRPAAGGVRPWRLGMGRPQWRARGRPRSPGGDCTRGCDSRGAMPAAPRAGDKGGGLGRAGPRRSGLRAQPGPARPGPARPRRALSPGRLRGRGTGCRPLGGAGVARYKETCRGNGRRAASGRAAPQSGAPSLVLNTSTY